jgi:nucleotide sugar dehydrogenase
VVLIAVRALVDGETVDLEPVESALAATGPDTGQARLVLVASTLPAGATRALAERVAGPTTFVAHVPERLQAGHGVADLRLLPHLVGGLDQAASGLAALVVGTYTERPIVVASPEVSELAKLLENAFRAVGIALVAEVSRLAGAAGVSASEVAEAAATKPFGYFPFHPGPGVGGHCIPGDLELLRETAAGFGHVSGLIDATAAILAEMPARTIDALAASLDERGVGLAGSAVLLVGTGFKPGSADQTASVAHPLVRELRRRGATPLFLDSANDRLVVDAEPVRKVERQALGEERPAAALVLAGDTSISGAELSGAAAVVLDLGGAAFLAPGPDFERTRL